MTVFSGGATLVFDCAQGSISQDLALDSNQSFQIEGTYQPTQTGPLSPGGTSPVSIPATYKGILTRPTRMSLTVSLVGTNGSTVQQSYQLTYGIHGTLEICITPL